MSSASIDEILHFWFEELSRKDWFRKDEALDSTIASRFGAMYNRNTNQASATAPTLKTMSPGTRIQTSMSTMGCCMNSAERA